MKNGMKIMKWAMMGIVVLSMIAMATIPMDNGSVKIQNANVQVSTDIHELNAQIYSNLTISGVAPGFLSEQHPSGYLPQDNYIIARSPGASTLTVSVNGSFSYNDYPFVNIVDLPLVLNVSKDTPLIITVRSDSLNYTRILYYRADVKTNVEYITYLESISPKTVSPGYTVGNIFIAVIYTLTGVVISLLITVFTLSELRSNPDVEKRLKGGTK